MRLRIAAVALMSLFPILLSAQSQSRNQPWQLGPFTRPVDGPVISPNPASVFHDPLRPEPVHWEALHTFNPAAAVLGDKVVVLYRAEDDSGAMEIGGHTSRLGLAESADGVHFTRMPEPVFYPAADSQQGREWPGGVEDPRIVESPEGGYVMTYTQWNRKTYTIGIATSPDLVHWTKHGPALGETGPYGQLMYKSGGIVTELKGGHLVAAKIGGRYWMYWGEIEIRVASSDDLIHWTPVEEAPGKPVVVLRNRPGNFDSGFPEVGPPPILTPEGIVLIYNGKNASGVSHSPGEGTKADGKLGPGAYAAGEALFAADQPIRLIARTKQPVLKPERAFERAGQYAAGTTFAEGLVFFHSRWLLYYGCADSLVGVAETAPFRHVD